MTGEQAWVATIERLWPGATVEIVGRGHVGEASHQFAFLPDAKRPRLLLPAEPPRAGATALRRYSHDLGPRQRVARSLLAVAMRTGLPQWTLRDRLSITDGAESVESHLSALLGRPVVVSVGLGTVRANRKPILHVLTPDGAPVAFVKVGDSDVARELIGQEAAALKFLEAHPPSGIAVPRVLHHGEWGDVALLVLSALPTSATGWRPRRRPPLAAMRALFATDRVTVATVAGSGFLHRLAAAASDMSDAVEADRFTGAVHRVGEAYGSVELRFGLWHGDWTPWNMAWHRSTLQLWDFERLDRGVPEGFDLLHYRLQETLRKTPGTRYTRWPSEAVGMLAPLGLPGRAARCTVELYVLELCRRYVLAAQRSGGEPLRQDAVRLLRLLDEYAGRVG